MYQIGDRIMYGNTGVCVVKDITTLDLRGVDKNKRYYVLVPLYQDGVIHTPVENNKVPIRPVISRGEAEKLVDRIPEVKAAVCHEKNLTALRNHYQECMGTYACSDLVEMTMSIYAKKRDAERQQKKFGQTDEKYLRRAEDLLFGELSVALDVPRDKVQDYIAARLKGKPGLAEA